ncbi:hypothetical protein B0H19DRAFT_1088750 [Mycena capillaripes]|nr:hypothetical protein B0H19DRAFT_1088750 [Mycena capillaripes]
MVLTRRAYKSIIRWLPNEILAEVIRYSASDSYRDLLALCRTSRLINGLAISILYRNICLTTLSATQKLFATLRKHAAASPRAHLVRRLKIASGENDDDLQLSDDLIDDLAAVFPSFRHLRSLELLVHAPLDALLSDLHFPELVLLRSSVAPSFSAALRSFINRHPTLTSLELFRSRGNLPMHGTLMPDLGTLTLPYLTNYSGPGCFASGLIVETKSLQTLTVTWYTDDPSLAPALAALGACTSPTTATSALGTFCDSVSELEMLRCIVQSMPHVAVVQLYRIITAADRFSQDAVREIAAILRRFSALYVLKFLDSGADPDHAQWLSTDRRIVKSWGKASPTLFMIELHGRVWKRTDNIWVVQLL